MMKKRKSTPNWILGINSAYHEPAACLLRDGGVVAAVEEERFNRIRHGKAGNLLNPHVLPEESIRYCLAAAGIRAKDISHVGYSLVPGKRFATNVGIDDETVPGAAGTSEGEREFYRLLRVVPQRLSETLGEDISDRFQWIEHHLCHAASAFFASPFERAAILSVDGIGENTSTWFGVGEQSTMRALREIHYPNSLGFLWTKAARYLGFGPYGQWKVMGLAGYGDPDRFYQGFRSFVWYDGDGDFVIDPRCLQFRTPNCSGLARLFGPHREPDDEIEDRHRDFAAALQRITNEALLAFCRHLHQQTRCRYLCQAGGVGLNCISNRVILEDGPFDQTFVQPAANDAGTALGACYYIWHEQLGKRRESSFVNAYLGPSYTTESHEWLPTEGTHVTRPKDVEAEVASLLASGEIVAWFQDRMEFGPRALGNRSILADPRRADMVHRLNDRVKHREFFRPFAGSVLTERAGEWFEIAKSSAADAFMLIARKVRRERLGCIPAVTHIDGTCRLQRVDRATNPRFHRLLVEFEQLTGVPVLLNTSFNDREPIICSPQDAVSTCLKAGIRFLAIGDRLVEFDGHVFADDLGDSGSFTLSCGHSFDPTFQHSSEARACYPPARQATGRMPAAIQTAPVTTTGKADADYDEESPLNHSVQLAFRSR